MIRWTPLGMAFRQSALRLAWPRYRWGWWHLLAPLAFLFGACSR
jgi:hypothetical protein